MAERIEDAFAFDPDDLLPLERAFYNEYMEANVIPPFRDLAWARSGAHKYAVRQAKTVRAYQREAGVVEVSTKAWDDLLDELASTRRECESVRELWKSSDAECRSLDLARKAAEARVRELESDVHIVQTAINKAGLREKSLTAEIDRLHDEISHEIRLARTLIRAADKALS